MDIAKYLKSRKSSLIFLAGYAFGLLSAIIMVWIILR